MAVPFGFSVGDFIATVGLASDVINALRDTGEAVFEYQGLLDQLDGLDLVFSKLMSPDLLRGPGPETAALYRLACRCQQLLETFWRKIRKYQPSLRINGSGSKLKDGWTKVRWTVLMRQDVSKFQSSLKMYLESIGLILVTIQMFVKVETIGRFRNS